MNNIESTTGLMFEKFINQTTYEIKQEAILQRALTDKITSESINQKITAQVNSINYGIKKINSKFTEKSKNYNIIKEAILDTMTKYEDSLKKLSQFYDSKIEQLIIRKFELQLNLIGIMTKQEVFNREEKAKEESKQENKIKNIFKLGIKKAIDKIKLQKKENQINLNDIRKLQDKEQVNLEQEVKLETSINKTKEQIKINNEKIEKMNKEIYLITSEIKKLNERKKEAINYAMESGEKWILATVKKPKTFERITRFFSSKINTPKVIMRTIINPLNERIDEFAQNELINIS